MYLVLDQAILIDLILQLHLVLLACYTKVGLVGNTYLSRS
jgi:hypothetical protein